jgi:TatD DNase family protein
MSLVDTHAHLDLLKEPIGQVLQKAHHAGVAEIITIGIDLESSRRAVELAETYPQIHAVVGMHPHDASQLDDLTLREIAELASHPRVVGIGETGLDFYRNLSPRADQERSFRSQL